MLQTVAGAPVVMFRHNVDVKSAESAPNLNSRWRLRYDALCQRVGAALNFVSCGSSAVVLETLICHIPRGEIESKSSRE